METQEISTGVYDLTIMMRPADLDTLEADGVLEKFECERFYKHELYGQEVATCHFEEAYVNEVIEILSEKNIESDIKISPFFHGDEVIKNAYTRLTDGKIQAFSNLKTSEEVALQMTKLLKQLDDLGIDDGRDVILANIKGFHGIGFIADPLLEPKA